MSLASEIVSPAFGKGNPLFAVDVADLPKAKPLSDVSESTVGPLALLNGSPNFPNVSSPVDLGATSMRLLDENPLAPESLALVPRGVFAGLLVVDLVDMADDMASMASPSRFPKEKVGFMLSDAEAAELAALCPVSLKKLGTFPLFFSKSIGGADFFSDLVGGAAKRLEGAGGADFLASEFPLERGE